MGDVDENYKIYLNDITNAIPDLTGIYNQYVDIYRTIAFNPLVPLSPALDELNDQAERFTDALDRISSIKGRLGDPAAIRAASDGWNTDVGGQTSTVAGDLAPELLAGSQEWKGDAADQYKNVIAAQTKALAGVKGLTDNAVLALNFLASGNATYIVGIGMAIHAFRSDLVNAVGSATTVIGLIAAIGQVDAAIRNFATALDGAANTFNNSLDENTARITAVTATGAPYTSAGWPKSPTADLADASVKDGPSKWVPKDAN